MMAHPDLGTVSMLEPRPVEEGLHLACSSNDIEGEIPL
jgi:hypothetical protein